MDYDRASYRVGVVVLASITLTIFFIFSITNLGEMLTERREYRVRFEYLNGLKEAAEVYYAGLQVGLVRRITLNRGAEGGALVIIELDSSIELRSEDKASIATEGLLGVKLIDIVPGRRNARILSSTDLLEGTPAPTIKGILTAANRTADKVSEAVDVISGFFAGAELEHSIRNTLVKVSKTLDEIGKAVNNVVAITSDTKTGVHRFFLEEEGMTSKLNRLVDKNAPKVDRLVDHLAQTAAVLHRLDRISGDLEKLASQLSAVTDQKQGKIKKTIDDLQAISANMKAFSADIKRHPWKLLRR